MKVTFDAEMELVTASPITFATKSDGVRYYGVEELSRADSSTFTDWFVRTTKAAV
jgi:hypothetical protein